MECSLHCSLATADGSRAETIDATAIVGAESIRLLGPAGIERAFDIRDIVGIGAKDRTVRLDICNGSSVVLDRLGGRQDELMKGICRSKNDLALADLLPNEVPRLRGIVGDLRRSSDSGAPGQLEKCELRVYHDALVLVPEKSMVVRFPLSGLASVGVEKYSLAIHLEGGRSISIAKLGRELEPTRRAIADAMTECRAASASLLKDLVPAAEPGALDEWAKRIAGGRFVRLSDLEASFSGVTKAIGDRLERAGIGDQIDHLSSIGSSEMSRVGMRRRVRGGEAAEEFWTLVPIPSYDGGSAGNAIAFDGTDHASPGGATLFFRILPRQRFKAIGGTIDPAEMEGAMESTALGLEWNALQREPLTLSSEDILLPDNARHRHAINIVPGLKGLRERFIGKVVHSSPERWAEVTRELLGFNVSASRDDEVFAQS